MQKTRSRSLISSVERLRLLGDCSDSGNAGDPDFSPAVSHEQIDTELYTLCEQ